MNLLYKSTRSDETVTASQAILQGLSKDGGLFVPTSIPKLDVDLDKLAAMDYQQTAYEVMSRFLTDFTEEELDTCVENAYGSKSAFPETVAPLSYVTDTLSVLELWHGPTSAFKDMALQILPEFMSVALKKHPREDGKARQIAILTATSGDTGKAALEGFKDVDGIRIMVFYPENGVSEMQKYQMIRLHSFGPFPRWRFDERDWRGGVCFVVFLHMGAQQHDLWCHHTDGHVCRTHLEEQQH